jgi:CRP-like cAMP-binding protein
MACEPTILRDVPLFSLLDDDELRVLAAQVELRTFAARQRIYRIGDPAGQAYVLVSGEVQVTTIDEDHQDVVFDQPASGDFFGFASMLDQTPHQTTAIALQETRCVEVDRDDIAALVQQKPHAGMDMLTVLGQHLHAAQQLVRGRAARNPNDMIEGVATIGERIADVVAGFGGSWNLMLSMLAALQAPVIMMSQNRQDTKDRLRGELDYEVNRRAASEIQGLARKLNMLIDKVGDLDDTVRTGNTGAHL